VNKGSMAVQDSNDRIAELLKQACPPAAASPVFKAKLQQHLNDQAGALGTESPKPLWQQPFLWIPTAAAAVALALVIYFVIFHSVPLTVTTSDATGIRTTAAILNGNLDSLGAADSVDVSFEWGVSTDYGNETTPELRTAAGSVQADLSGLAPNTTYHFRIKAAGRDGTVYGPDMQFTTGPAPPVATTSDVAKIKTTSATLRGSLDSLGTATTVTVSFEYGTATGSYTHTTADQARTSIGAFSADLTGLTPGTTHYYRAKADGDGDAVYGVEKSFTTPTTAPSVTTNDVTSVATTSATLNGELSSLGTASSINVSFEWGAATGSYAHTTADQARTSTGAFSADLTGLTPGTTYYYRAKADGDGDAVYGAEKTFTTLTTPPSLTTGSATEVRCTSATLNGILDSLGTAGSVEVSFEWGLTTAYGSETTPGSKTTTGDFNATLTNLSPSITYHFRAKAVGDGVAYSADMTFTTGSTPPAQETWYLSKDVSGSVNVMYVENTTNPTDIVQLRHNGTTSRIWRANQSSRETTYPAGNWTVQLTLGDFEVGHTDNVEIGTWDGNVFTPYGVYIIHGLVQGDEVYVVGASISAGSFTVPSGGYVAIRITATSSPQWLDVHVGGSQSYVISPAYPEPTAPTVATGAVTGVEQTTATLNGYLDSLGTASGVMVCFEWGTTTDYGNPIDMAPGTPSGNFSAILANLTPSTTYHFRAKAVGDGTNYGVDMVFTAPP
jgi:hypothetical protein